jgi:hypothetical protein
MRSLIWRLTLAAHERSRDDALCGAVRTRTDWLEFWLEILVASM